MPKARTGSIRTRTITDKGKTKEIIYARVTYMDQAGRRREIERRAETKSHARALIKDILRDLDDRGEKSLDSYRMTFADLADYFEKNYLQPAEYSGARKVSGRRTFEEGRRLKEVLVSHFKAARLREITHGDIERYKAKRLSTPTIHGSERSITTVNRELSLLRRMLNVAAREGWIVKSPFLSGDSLISTADENKRERILTREEERRLLAVCEGKRAHLKALLVCALDTGMRRGEMFTLKWEDVDLAGRSIHLQAFNTKTAKKRNVPISSRLYAELARMYRENEPAPDALVFGISRTVKGSFKTACRLAGVGDFRLHDARHTAATRLIQGGMPIAEVARVLGHSSISTTYRYVNASSDTTARAADVMNRFHEDREEGDPLSIN